MKVYTLSVILIFISANAISLETTIEAEVIRIIDGDTVEVKAHPWPDFSPTTSIRLYGIDTPELRSKCKLEKQKAIEAKAYLESIITEKVFLRNVHYGKYAGRHLGEIITTNGVNISQALIENNYARKYDGGKREGWCEE